MIENGREVNSPRNIVLDTIRGISTIGIVSCHICFGIDGVSWLGSYLGGTFNCVFFSLSALIFGRP